MREFLATKDEHEREEDEAERLVRPQPKLKPPRKDRRREEMKVDRDRDTDADPDLKGDPDLSLNYKSIGGSVLRRYVRVALEQEDRVKVVNKETDKVVMVSPETLKDNGSKYEEVEEDDGVGEDDGSDEWVRSKAIAFVRRLMEIEKKDPNVGRAVNKIVDSDSEWGDLPDSTPLSDFSDLRPHLKALGEFQTVGHLRAFTDWTSENLREEDFAEKPPAKPAPAEQKPAEPAKAEAPEKAPEDKPAEPKAETPKAEEALASKIKEFMSTVPEEQRPVAELFTKFLETMQAQKPAVEEPAKSEPPKSEAPKAEEPAPAKSDAPKGEEKPAPEKKPEAPKGEEKPAPTPKKPKEPWPGRRKVDRDEVEQAQSLLAKELPPKLAAKFMKMNMHPDDTVQLVAKFKGYRQLGAFESDDELKSTLGKLKKSFTLDANAVAPPETWKTKKGEVPFADLSPEQQEKALRQHRSAAIAYNIAMRERAIDTLAKRGLSRSAAAASIDLALKKDPEPKTAQEHESYHEKRRQRVAEVAKEHFIAASVDSKPIPAKERFNAIEAARSLPEEAQQIALAKLQASDLREVTSKYLGAEITEKGRPNPGVISEREPASKIVAKINHALQDLHTLSQDYPAHVRENNPDPARVFRAQVLSRLQKVAPEKAAEVQKHLAKLDREDYDKRKARHERALKTYEREHGEYESRFARWLKKKEKAESGETPYRSSPDKVAFDEPPPAPPTKPKAPKVPAGYFEVAHEDDVPSLRKSRNEMRETEERLGLVQRLVNKVKSLRKRKSASLYSSYGYRDLTMGAPMPTEFGTREAVYHGVEPDKAKPYPAWEQAHVCEMGSSDSNAILSAARDWLKSPVLAKSIDGMPADARFRAALDLAIRDAADGKYGSAVDAVAYNELLSKLSGDHSDPLGTIGRKEASLVVEVRAFAARVASVDPSLAYDLIAFAEQPAAPAEAVKPVASTERIASASEDTYAALRSTVIRVASQNGAVREQLHPVLRLIKTIDEVRALRTASGD